MHIQGGKLKELIASLFKKKLYFLHFPNDASTIGVMGSIPILGVLPVGHHSVGVTDGAVLLRLVLHDGEPVALDVGLHPKVGEEEEEEDSVNPDEVNPQGNLVVALLHEVVLADMNGNQNELRLGKM